LLKRDEGALKEIRWMITTLMVEVRGKRSERWGTMSGNRRCAPYQAKKGRVGGSRGRSQDRASEKGNRPRGKSKRLIALWARVEGGAQESRQVESAACKGGGPNIWGCQMFTAGRNEMLDKRLKTQEKHRKYCRWEGIAMNAGHSLRKQVPAFSFINKRHSRPRMHKV